MRMMKNAAANDNSRAEGLLVDALERAAERLIQDSWTFTELEKVLLTATNELVRRLLERRLQQRADSFGDEVTVNGTRYRRHEPGTVRYFSLCGPLDVTRWTYRLAHGRNGPTEVPIELQAGLIYRTTPALAFALANGHANGPIRSVERDLLAAGRRPPSRSTMHRICTKIGLDVRQTVELVEPSIREEEALPRDAVAINIGLDRTTIPMEEADPSKAKRTKSRFCVRYRMGYVGTVCLTDKDGGMLQARRYAVAAHEGPQHVLGRMMADVNLLLKKRRTLVVGVVQDGAPEMWNLMRDALRSSPRAVKRGWRETIDRFHLTERMANVLEHIYPKEEAARRDLLNQWRLLLDTDEEAVKHIDRELEARAVASKNKTAIVKSLDFGGYVMATRYFRYASLLPGLHSGSGVTEGACKYLITSRAKRSGQRWRRRGIEGVLALRTLLASERLTPFWTRFAPRFVATCRSAA